MTPDLTATLTTCASFPEILTALHAAQYTGPITFHFASGQPKLAELPIPTPTTLIVPLDRRKSSRRATSTP